MQVGIFRILITTVFLLLIGFKSLLKIKRRHWYYLLLNGFLGTFFPVFLFAFAVEHIDSSITSILNIIKKYLHDLNALSIAVGNFVLLIIPTFIVMWSTDFFGTFEINKTTTTAFIWQFYQFLAQRHLKLCTTDWCKFLRLFFLRQ